MKHLFETGGEGGDGGEGGEGGSGTGTEAEMHVGARLQGDNLGCLVSAWGSALFCQQRKEKVEGRSPHVCCWCCPDRGGSGSSLSSCEASLRHIEVSHGLADREPQACSLRVQERRESQQEVVVLGSQMAVKGAQQDTRPDGDQARPHLGYSVRVRS